LDCIVGGNFSAAFKEQFLFTLNKKIFQAKFSVRGKLASKRRYLHNAASKFL
jgi:hypothetical protein